MKKLSLALFAIAMIATANFGQGKANFSGTWNLDKEKSTFAGPMRMDGMTLTVTQSAKDIKVDTAVKRLPPPEGAGANAPTGAPPPGFGGPRRGFGGPGMDGSATYSLDGKELKVEIEGPNGKMPVIYKGTAEANGSLKLSSSRTFNGPNGEIVMITKETWTLSADGKMLTIDRENTTPRGPQSSKLVFVKS
jgi:hypothetical protein